MKPVQKNATRCEAHAKCAGLTHQRTLVDSVYEENFAKSGWHWFCELNDVMPVNKATLITCLVLLLIALSSSGQGTFVYDQQSSDESYIAGGVPIQVGQPGQSFTPTLSSVGFIRLALWDINLGNTLGATIHVDLRSSSIAGPILGSTEPVSMPDSFRGVANFFFATPIAVTPGTTYYFQPRAQTGGDAWNTASYNSYNYPGGMLFYGSTPALNSDMWFREGIYNAPEPSAASLFLASIALMVSKRRTCKSKF